MTESLLPRAEPKVITHREGGIGARRRLGRAAAPVLVFLFVLLNWSGPRGLDAVDVATINVGLAVYRLAVHAALLVVLLAIVGVAVWPPRRLRRSPWFSGLGLAALSLVTAVVGVFVTGFLGA